MAAGALPGRPAFRFTHANVFNKMYNPGCDRYARRVPPPVRGRDLHPGAAEVGLHPHAPVGHAALPEEFGRVIQLGGRAVITYFLLNDESRALVAKDRDDVKMKVDWDGDPLCRVANLEVPSTPRRTTRPVSAPTRRRRVHGREITFGNWCGRPARLGLQDVMIVTKV